MKLGNLVGAILLLMFGLKLLGSPLFNSMLNTRVDAQMDYRWLPSIGLFAFAVIVCLAKINATARPEESQEAEEEVPEKTERRYRLRVPPAAEGIERKGPSRNREA